MKRQINENISVNHIPLFWFFSHGSETMGQKSDKEKELSAWTLLNDIGGVMFAHKDSDYQSKRPANKTRNLDSTFKLKHVGIIDSGAKSFSLFIYTRQISENRNPMRLIVMSEKIDEYIGMYALERSPEGIIDNKLMFRFNDTKGGNFIEFTEKNPPCSIYLNYEHYLFFRMPSNGKIETRCKSFN